MMAVFGELELKGDEADMDWFGILSRNSSRKTKDNYSQDYR
jgi:hypothetical protein